MAEPMLKFDAVDLYYGPVQALKKVSLSVQPGVSRREKSTFRGSP